MKYIKIQKFWTLSNTDRIIAYLYSREGGYTTSRELERVCNIPTGDYKQGYITFIHLISYRLRKNILKK